MARVCYARYHALGVCLYKYSRRTRSELINELTMGSVAAGGVLLPSAVFKGESRPGSVDLLLFWPPLATATLS